MVPFIDMIFNGLSLSSIILLTTLGLAITFGLMKVINMAHGELLMIGAYVTFVVQSIFLAAMPPGAQDWYYPVALLLGFAVTFFVGMLLEVLVISRLYGRVIDTLLATTGISLILQQAARHIFGEQGVNVTAPSFLQGGITLGAVTLSYNRLFIIALAAVAVVGLWLLLFRTDFGLQMRAVMQNRDMAKCLGINSRHIDRITFSIGSGLAGLAGCSLALLGSVDAALGQQYIVTSFMAVVLGGVDSLLGTGIGAAIMGFLGHGIENFTSANISRAIVLVFIVIFLQFKPQGLFAGKSRALDE
jgi:urea transport system permease protein